MTTSFSQFDFLLKHCLQVFGVIIQLYIMLAGGISGLIVVSYLVLYTSWRWLAVLYLIWIWFIDRRVCERGGRRMEWMRELSCWEYIRDYFPISMKKSTEFELDPKRNYLFCCFPHGIIATGAFCAFATNACGITRLFPNHIVYTLTLALNFFFPINRDIILALGICSVSAESVNYILGKPEGGNIATIVVGGAKEALISQSNQYKIILRSRKGFIKLALKNGAPLVPVITFGETDIYTQLRTKEGFLFYRIQEKVKKWTGIAPIIPLGRAYTVIPLQKPITHLIGRPIDVKKIDCPSQEQIDALHETFISELTHLFDEHKKFYVKDWENVRLEIE